MKLNSFFIYILRVMTLQFIKIVKLCPSHQYIANRFRLDCNLMYYSLFPNILNVLTFNDSQHVISRQVTVIIRGCYASFRTPYDMYIVLILFYLPKKKGKKEFRFLLEYIVFLKENLFLYAPYTIHIAQSETRNS